MGSLLYLWHDFYWTHLRESDEDHIHQTIDFLQQYLPPKAIDDFFKIAENRPRPPAAVLIGRNIIILILTLGLSVAVKMTGNWYKTENEKEKLKKAKAEAELQNLKSQLNPHFLFNTLNNIYSLIYIDSERAQEALYDLSRLLRYVLYDNAFDQVPLKKELAFIESFIELMSLRLPKTTLLEIEIPEEDQGVNIAPMLFIPLIENAFKHGISSTSPSHIKITIEIDSNHTIKCVVRNSSFPKRDNDRSGSGIGLQNLERRLQLIYPDRYRFKIDTYGDEYVADLRINCNQ